MRYVFTSSGFCISPQPENWSDCFYWNVFKSTELLKQALDSGIKKVISVGTFIEYGEAGLKYEFIPIDIKSLICSPLVI